MKMRRIAAAVLILSLAAGGYALTQVSGQKDLQEMQKLPKDLR